MFESSKIEISRSALRTNLKFIQQRIGDRVKFCSVVKGNAYGHGLINFSQLAMEEGVDYFGVYSANEAHQLVENLDNKPRVFIMGYADQDAVEWAVMNKVEVSIFDLDRLERVIALAKRLKKPAHIHLEIETGMNRTGIDYNNVDSIIGLILTNKAHLKLIGVFTHLAGAESMANNFRVTQQIKLFGACKKKFRKQNIKPKYFHAACSAALMNYPETASDMVRIGIMQYGFWSNNETLIRYCGEKRNIDKLKRLIRWTSKVMSIKTVKKGEFVGYATTYLAQKNMTIGVVPIGYSHGYSRSLSNSGKVLVNGVEAPVVGLINMNAITIDITGIDGVEKGTEVVLIGKQKNKSISVASFGEMSNQLNYELLTRLPQDIPRTIIE